MESITFLNAIIVWVYIWFQWMVQCPYSRVTVEDQSIDQSTVGFIVTSDSETNVVEEVEERCGIIVTIQNRSDSED